MSRWNDPERRCLNSLGFLLAALDPLLEQVLVVAVGAGAQREHAQVGELPAIGVYEHGHQAVLLALQLVHPLHDLVHSHLGGYSPATRE